MWGGPDNRPERVLHLITVPVTTRALSASRPHYLVNFGKLLEAATISPCTFTMDHNAIIFSLIDRLVRGPDKDVRVPSVGSQKYPSYNVHVIYL